MHTISTADYRVPQKLHPLSLLAQLTSRKLNGCLRVLSGSTSWSLHLDQGNLVYAFSSVDPFGRLDRHLRRLSTQIPTLVSAVRVQVRLLFDHSSDERLASVPDYQAICWLVNQHYLTSDQAALLIEDLAKEVLESFLSVKQGTYDIIDSDQLEHHPKFCRLELRPLVEYCQTQLRRQPSSGRSSLNSSSQSSNSTVYPSLSSSQKPPIIVNSDPQDALLSDLNDHLKTAHSKRIYTIACIDDSPTVLQAIKSFLDDKSFSVLMINNPVQALMQIMRSKPDLILLDVEMPNLDGYELCSLLRRHSVFKTTPIIMVTGNNGFIDRAKAKLVRASGFLSKPFNQSDLLKMVFKHLT